MNILGLASSLLGGGLLGAAGGSPLSSPLGALTNLVGALGGGQGSGQGGGLASLIEPLIADGGDNTASVNQLGDFAQLAGTFLGA